MSAIGGTLTLRMVRGVFAPPDSGFGFGFEAASFCVQLGSNILEHPRVDLVAGALGQRSTIDGASAEALRIVRHALTHGQQFCSECCSSLPEGLCRKGAKFRRWQT